MNTKPIPKQTIIAGKVYKIKINPDVGGGRSSTTERLIEIGAYDIPTQKTILLHEIIETLFYERLHTYECANRDKLLILNHGDMTNFADDLALALKDW